MSTGAVENGYSYATLQWFLIGTAAFVGLFGLSIVTKEAGACGAFDLLHRFAEKYLPTPVLALFKWLFACRTLVRHELTSSWHKAPFTNPVVQGASNTVDASKVGGAGPKVFRVKGGKASASPLSLDDKTIKITGQGDGARPRNASDPKGRIEAKKGRKSDRKKTVV